MFENKTDQPVQSSKKIFQSGVLDKTRAISNILMIILVAGNIFFSIQYTEGLKQQQNNQADKIGTNIQVSRFLKLFVDVVLSTKTGQTISYDDRVKLENDVRQIMDIDITKQWDNFVGSKNGQIAQENAISLMKLLTDKLIVN